MKCFSKAVGWVMLFYAPTFDILMAGRITTGIGAGLCSPACFIILSEYALVRYRGQHLCALSSLFLTLSFSLPF
jgi:predicted MFS family arabinose efflux permease